MAQVVRAHHVGAVRAFAERLLASVIDDAPVRAANGDFACSPIGLWLALSAVAAGARSQTAQELHELLGAAGAEAASAATEVAARLSETEGLAVATGVWSRIPVYRDFRDDLPDISFGHLDPANPSAINAWVRRATGGLFRELPDCPDEDDLLLLVNALTVEGKWASGFKQQNTADRTFTDARGVEHLVPTMAKTLPGPQCAWTVEDPSGSAADEVDVVALLCEAESGRLPLQVSLVLGAPDRGPAEVLPAAWAPHEHRRPVDADEVTIALPRLHLRTRLEAERHLAPLGAPLSVSARADFSGMSPEPLRIAGVTQESVLRMDEEGVRAAAVTQVRKSTRSVSGRVPRTRHRAFDRPFGLVLFAGSSGLPLFAAWQASAPRSPHS
ncbi:serpin family protein [Streptomyces sp. NPDC101165]|uniref:serpin family protein n=1 Tax=Streptomyces sp. NPDC101165 TaxID=3366119 RepID=UPI0037F521BE